MSSIAVVKDILRSMSIRHRLMGVVGIATGATLALALLAWHNSRLGSHAADSLAAMTGAVRASMNADMMHDSIRADVFAAQLAATSGNAAALGTAANDFEDAAKQMEQSFRAAREAALPAQALEAVEAAGPVVQRYVAAARAAIGALKNSPANAAPQIAAFLAEFEATEHALEKSDDAIEQAAEAQRTQAKDSLAQGATVTLAVIAASLSLLLVLSGIVIASIMRPLIQLQRAVRNLSSDDGDLTRRLPRGSAEFGDLSEQFNAFLQKIADVVGSVQASAQEISSASGQIAEGNMELSVRTEQGAASLQQTASSMEQITATVNQSADAARQADAYAVSATQVAAKGGEAMSRVVGTMEDIEQASRKIGDIIGVIDAIAFQTNILALNAAVEAARAGEQGRGFAVVAGEVRSLAQRSAEAAREIKVLVATSVEKVELGSQLVRDAGATMDEIVASVGRVTSMISEITRAAEEQSSGIALVNGTVAQLDASTQQNAALVEQTAAAAKVMATQARDLEHAVSGFRTTTERGLAA